MKTKLKIITPHHTISAVVDEPHEQIRNSIYETIQRRGNLLLMQGEKTHIVPYELLSRSVVALEGPLQAQATP